jgi:hypothetical protein
MEGFKTLREAIIHFADFENCKSLMMKLRWPDGVVKCPHCGSDHVTYLARPRVWKCYGKHPQPKFSGPSVISVCGFIASGRLFSW